MKHVRVFERDSSAPPRKRSHRQSLHAGLLLGRIVRNWGGFSERQQREKATIGRPLLVS